MKRSRHVFLDLNISSLLAENKELLFNACDRRKFSYIKFPINKNEKRYLKSPIYFTGEGQVRQKTFLQDDATHKKKQK